MDLYLDIKNQMIGEIDKKMDEVKVDYQKLKDTVWDISTANVGVNSLAIACGTTSVATAVTVVGIPVAAITGAVGAVSAITSIVLTSIEKKKTKKFAEKKKFYFELLMAKLELEKLIAPTSEGQPFISREMHDKAREIFRKVMKRDLLTSIPDDSKLHEKGELVANPFL